MASFDWLREPDPDAVATPPVLMAFDLLRQDGREFIGRPLRERRARLEEVGAGSDFVLPVRRLARNGFEAWTEVVAHDYEGLVAKDETSLYEAGPTRRSAARPTTTDPASRARRRAGARRGVRLDSPPAILRRDIPGDVKTQSSPVRRGDVRGCKAAGA